MKDKFKSGVNEKFRFSHWFQEMFFAYIYHECKSELKKDLEDKKERMSLKNYLRKNLQDLW